MNDPGSLSPPGAALLLDPRDSVATALQDLSLGQTVMIRDRGGAQLQTIEARTPVPGFHKLALRRHAAGEAVIKYGEAIGRASRPIQAGEHVHTHNLRSLRSEGDGHPGV